MLIKGKRTKRPRPASPPAAACALPTSSSSTTTFDSVCNSPTTTTDEEVDLAYCLILLAQGHRQSPSPLPMCGAVYECKTCNRCFPSFQALGGHRASHKKPKHSPPEEIDSHQHQPPASKGAPLALQLTGNSSNTLSAVHNTNPKLKVHACGICGAEFSSGQALGGHMRRHRSPIAPSPATLSPSPEPLPSTNLHLCLDLDLNLPADQLPETETQPQSPDFLFGSNDKALVFTSPLVDCRY